MRRNLLLLLSILILVAGASCAPVSKVDNASQAVCQNIVLFTASVEKLKDESQFADQTALKAQFDVVRMNFNNLRMSISELEAVEKEDFETAVEGLMDAVDSLPEDTSVPDALTTLEQPIEQVLVATENLKTGLNCIVEL